MRVLVGLFLRLLSPRLGTAGPPHGRLAASGSGGSTRSSAAARRVGDGPQQLHLRAAVPPVSHLPLVSLPSLLPTHSQRRAAPGSPLYVGEGPAPPSGPAPPCGSAPPAAAQNGPARPGRVKPLCSRRGSAQGTAVARSYSRLELSEGKASAGRALLPWPLLTRRAVPSQPQAWAPELSDDGTGAGSTNVLFSRTKTFLRTSQTHL